MGILIESKPDIQINIVGAGLAGLSSAVHIAKDGISCRLISSQNSERAHSVLAEGGINGAIDTMHENDSIECHYLDTINSACGIADTQAVRNLTNNAPDIIYWLEKIGVPFQKKGDIIQLRNFGGQKKKRTAFAKNSTGKVIMTALIDEARRFEAKGLIDRYPTFDLLRLVVNGKKCEGLIARNNISGEITSFPGPVIMATGGLNGLFPGKTTGSTANTSDAAAAIFSQGVRFSNLEMIQYHPTTLSIPGKRLLVSEAARGEGGRLFAERSGERFYFMEEKYPSLKNLMPRDVISREEYLIMNDPEFNGKVFLDCTEISDKIWRSRLSELREEIVYYTKSDPKKVPIQVEPGIHYFMGGIDVDSLHRANLDFLYAAGECCSLYHGANRLGGNSMLGAIYGGEKAAESVIEDLDKFDISLESMKKYDSDQINLMNNNSIFKSEQIIGEILSKALGAARDKDCLSESIEKLCNLLAESKNERIRKRILLGLAILKSAYFRKESRGAHYRIDYPEKNDEKFLGTMISERKDRNEIQVYLRAAK